MTISKSISTQHYKNLQNILGKNYIQEQIESPYDFISIASQGIDAHIILNFRKYFGIEREDAADMLNISAPTIYRWIKQNKKLERNYTIQLLELTDLFLYGIDVFESNDNFFKWLDLPNTALGGMHPKNMLDIPGGIAKVRELLGRMDFGVYS